VEIVCKRREDLPDRNGREDIHVRPLRLRVYFLRRASGGD
jgi:hypothetical protein